MANINQNIECPVCLGEYSCEAQHKPVSVHIPKILRCGHTVCNICASILADKKNKTLDCPICRLTSPCPSADDLPNNDYLITAIMKIRDVRSVVSSAKESRGKFDTICYECSSHDVVVQCLTCNVTLCIYCCSEIHKFIATNNHVLMSIGSNDHFPSVDASSGLKASSDLWKESSELDLAIRLSTIEIQSVLNDSLKKLNVTSQTIMTIVNNRLISSLESVLSLKDSYYGKLSRLRHDYTVTTRKLEETIRDITKIQSGKGEHSGSVRSCLTKKYLSDVCEAKVIYDGMRKDLEQIRSEFMSTMRNSVTDFSIHSIKDLSKVIRPASIVVNCNSQEIKMSGSQTQIKQEYKNPPSPYTGIYNFMSFANSKISSPSDITFSKSLKSFLIVSGSTGILSYVTMSGEVIKTENIRRTGADDILCPIAIDYNESMLCTTIADSSGRKVTKILNDPAAKRITFNCSPYPLNTPTGITSNEDGEIVVASRGDSGLTVIGPEFTQSYRVVDRSHMQGLRHCDYVDKNVVVVADESHNYALLYDLRTRGHSLKISITKPFGICTNGPYIASTSKYEHKVSLIDVRAEKIVQQIGSKGTGYDEFSSPLGIIFTGPTSLLVADSENHRIVKIDNIIRYDSSDQPEM